MRFSFITFYLTCVCLGTRYLYSGGTMLNDGALMDNGSILQSGNVTTLHVGVLLELTGHWYSQYAGGFVDVFKYVFDEVERRQDILPGFAFEMTVINTKGHNGLAATELVQALQDGKPKVAILGPTISDSLSVTGQICPLFNVIQLSYIAVTATTSKKYLYPTLFRVNAAAELFDPLRIKMMKHFGWSRVGTISYQDDINLSQMSTFHDLLHVHNITLAFTASFRDFQQIQPIIESFKKFDVRIIMATMHPKHAVEVFCKAYKAGLYGARYAWIFGGATLHPTWRTDYSFISCTHDQFLTAIDGLFILKNIITSTSSEATISGKTPTEEVEEVGNVLATSPYKQSIYLPWLIDTAWSLAIGKFRLNNSLKYLEQEGLSLHNYTNNQLFIDAILKGMHEVSFHGVSGPVSFDDAGNRVGLTYIKQNLGNRTVDVAYYDLHNDAMVWQKTDSELWEGGRVPQDRFIYRERVQGASIPAIVGVASINCVGCAVSLIFFVLNLYYRNTRSIKMSSPVLNYVIIIGCLCMYTVVFAGALATSDTTGMLPSSMCMVETWIVTVGFTLLFGALFAKTYRVYVIFRENRVRRNFIKDYHLLTMVGVFLLIDVIILSTWSAMYPLRKQRIVTVTGDDKDNNIVFLDVYLQCTNVNQNYWIITVYVYKGFLLLFGVFLAWETRKVVVPELNDSKYIGACVYNVVVVCLFGVPLAHVMPIEQTTLTFVLESCLIIFCTTMCQLILFIPKDRNKVEARLFAVKPEASASGSGTGTGFTPLGSSKDPSLNTLTEHQHAESILQQHEDAATKQQTRNSVFAEALAITKLKKSISSHLTNTMSPQ